MDNIKPMRACKLDIDKLTYPLAVTPKLDGIRCMMVDGVAMSKSMKPIPNRFVQEQLRGLHGLDGELMVNGDFNSVQSAIMSHNGEPDFTYMVFDHFLEPDRPYVERVDDLNFDWAFPDNCRCKVLNPLTVPTKSMLEVCLDTYIEAGYEGAMVRQPNGRYKFGQSTVNEGLLLKFKKFLDDEAFLLSFEEKMHNTNEATTNELGGTKRSSAKAGLVPAGTAGGVIVLWRGKEIKLGFGPGITDAIKQEWWDNRDELSRRTITFRYQELSAKGIPRFGKMIGFRHEDDISK